MSELLGSILDQVRLTTLVDIGITSLLIYWLFSLIRGTRAVRLVIGVSVLIVVYVLAVGFGLQLLTRILQGGAVVGLFALVVVFQPELRRGARPDRPGRLVLAGCCRRPIRGPSSTSPTRSRGRRPPVRRGPRRAHRPRARDRARGDRRDRRDDPRRLSADLPGTIFTPRTALHDGAVIIRGEIRSSPPARCCRWPRPRSTPSGSGPAIGRRSASPSRPTRSSSWSPRRTARSASSSAPGSCATSTRPQLARRRDPQTRARQLADGRRPREPRRRPRSAGASSHRGRRRTRPPSVGRTGSAVTGDSIGVVVHNWPAQARRDRSRHPPLRRPRPVPEHARVQRGRSRSTPVNQPRRHVPADRPASP